MRSSLLAAQALRAQADAAFMTTTAGQKSSLVTTERTRLSLADFAKGLMHLDQGEEESTSMLVYGDSNAGKTVLAGTLPEKTFWLVCEPGFKSASRWRAAQGLPPHKGARRITNSAEAWAAVEWLEDRERYSKLDWLVLDGLSTMQDRFRLAYAAEAFDINPAKRAHRNLPDRPDYFNTQNMLKSWIPRLVDMPVNLLITAHAYRTDLTEDGELLVFPGIQGKVTETSNAIAGLMDVTGYLEARRITRNEKSITRRRLWLASPTDRRRKDESDVRYIVGDKYNCLGEYVDEPTMPKIMSMVTGEE
ncbi:MAG TPA: AAA family ATPase [Candidatus Eisenbacteria bacterium]|nr:AAA family ATPase [Candidatus Eisenbacteria bacterium]